MTEVRKIEADIHKLKFEVTMFSGLGQKSSEYLELSEKLDRKMKDLDNLKESSLKEINKGDVGNIKKKFHESQLSEIKSLCKELATITTTLDAKSGRYDLSLSMKEFRSMEDQVDVLDEKIVINFKELNRLNDFFKVQIEMIGYLETAAREKIMVIDKKMKTYMENVKEVEKRLQSKRSTCCFEGKKSLTVFMLKEFRSIKNQIEKFNQNKDSKEYNDLRSILSEKNALLIEIDQFAKLTPKLKSMRNELDTWMEKLKTNAEMLENSGK